MKNRGVILFSLFLLLVAGGCSNDAIYYNTNQKRSIYFDKEAFRTSVMKEIPDTVAFSFALYNEDEYQYEIPVKYIGLPESEDRVFEVEIIKDSTTAVEGTHFAIGKLIVPENAIEGVLSITLKRTEEIMNHPVFLFLKFKENDYFKPLDNDHFRLSVVDGILPAPKWWSTNFLGDYSKNNDRLYRKLLEYYWKLEDSKPVFYAEKLKTYGLYLENAPAAFFQTAGNMIWIKYVFKPAYDYYSDPANKYDGFSMKNPDDFIR